MCHTTSPDTDCIIDVLFRVRADLPPVPKRAYNSSCDSHYADLSGTLDAVEPVLLAHKVLAQPSVTQNGRSVTVSLRLIHVESRQWAEQSLHFETANGTVHELASAITYGRRLCFATLLNLRTPDDDGQGAMQGQPAARVLTMGSVIRAARVEQESTGREAATSDTQPRERVADLGTETPAGITTAPTESTPAPAVVAAAPAVAEASPTASATPPPAPAPAVAGEPSVSPSPDSAPATPALSVVPAGARTASPAASLTPKQLQEQTWGLIRRYKEAHGREAAERVIQRIAGTNVPALVRPTDMLALHNELERVLQVREAA